MGTEECELVATTFSGRIFALRSRRLVSGAIALTNIPQDAFAARRTKLEYDHSMTGFLLRFIISNTCLLKHY